MSSALPAMILVIEPHLLMREALCAAISDESHLKVCFQASTVGDILHMGRRILPDIILFALSQFDRDNAMELAILRKVLPKVPILALTRNEVPGQEELVLEQGAHAVLTKSAPRAELIEALLKLRTQAFKNYATCEPRGKQGGSEVLCHYL